MKQTIASSRSWKYVIELALCIAFIGAFGLARAEIPSDSMTDNRLSGWWDTHTQPAVRAHACSVVIPPSNATDAPHMVVHVYNDSAAFQAASGAARTQYCVVSGRDMYLFCGADKNGDVAVHVNMAESSFALRSVVGRAEAAAGAGGASDFNVWGYYCSTSGCFGADDTKALDGVANTAYFSVSVIAACR